MSKMYLGLGSNVGERLENLREAVGRLPVSIRVLKKSSVFETAPVDLTTQPDYLNAVLETETDLSPMEALAAIKQIEMDMGREATVRFGPRNIDMDILFYDVVVMDTASLVIPHPRMHVRAFVLAPFSEIAPDRAHPILKKTVSELFNEMNDETQHVRRLDDVI